MIETSGVETVASSFAGAAAAIQWKARMQVARTAAEIAGTQRALIPTATGRTKGTISTTIGDKGMSAAVGPGGKRAHIARFLEYGTVKMSPRPFIGPSADKHLPGFEAALERLAEQI